MWRAFVALLLVACSGPTREAPIEYSGRGVVAQTFPFSIDGGQFGRELTGTTEATEIHNLEAIESRPAGWYYRYLPATDISTTEQFVPMFYDGSYVTSPNLTAAAQYGTILGFNEPDLSSQANMTVAAALALWPQLEATGRRLGAPAVASNASTVGGWLDLFVSGNGGGYVPHVDFIPLHFYLGTFTNPNDVGLLTYVNAVCTKYKKPVWITEFGMIGFPSVDPATWTYPSSAQAQAYMKAIIPLLRSNHCIERFAWYPNVASSAAISVNAGIANVALGNPDGTLTTLGTLYSTL